MHTLTTASWAGPFSLVEQESAISVLEDGGILYLPTLGFEFNSEEKALLTPAVLAGKSKNISFEPATYKLKGNISAAKSRLVGLMTRFFNHSLSLVHALLPLYQVVLEVGRTSYRPIETAGRKTSLLKDDTRLHVDAFPATPTHGKRILRVFTNVHPTGSSRWWQVGESFETVVRHFGPTLRNPIPGMRTVLSLLKITKSYRSLYDHYMLLLHNQMKKNDPYQKKVKKTDIHFPAGATWIVMTDCVSHAALSGQFLLEQTFYLPIAGMRNPEKSPLRILERDLNTSLVAFYSWPKI